jgi:two-component system sensor kinase FixL
VFAHELAQPLSAMAANAAAARNAAISCPHQACGNLAILEDLVSDSSRLRSVFQRIRALARGDVGVRGSEDVNDLIRETLKIAEKVYQPERIVIRMKLGRGLPLVTVDTVQIQQVILNLLSNAFDSVSSSETSNPTVEILSCMGAGGGVEIAVKDNGTGIPDELLPRIAQDFVTTKPDGNGIGLLLCRTMAERHDGSLTAENNKRRGATFRLTLPAGRKRRS